MKMKKTCAHCEVVPWYKEKLYVVALVTGILLTISYFVEPLNMVFDTFVDYFGRIWWAVLLGLLIGGFIDKFIPETYVAKFLSSRKKTTILSAVGLGFLMSACSHGILAISIELHKKGASVPAVIAFLLASPWANISITFMMIALFGWKGILLILGAILIAVITGFIYQILDRKGLIEKSLPVKIGKGFSVRADIKKRWAPYRFNFVNDVGGIFAGAWKLAKMVLWWLLIGVMLASFIGAFVPTTFFNQYMGPTVMGLIITLIAATIIEVCSEGSSPIAFEIYKQTGAFGNAFAFLLAGVATDYTEIGLIWANIGKKAAIWLPIITVPQIILLGYLFNILL